MSIQWPWYLLGLLLLGLPWLLHLFSRHFAPERPFPTKQFLEAAEPPKSRTRQLQYRLLLLLRALMVLALCALFAMPWFNRQLQGQNVEHIDYLVIDHSLSMQGKGRWQSAITLMDEHIGSLAPTATSKLFTFDGTLNEIEKFELSEPGYLRADFGDLIRQLDARASNEEVPVQVTFITDAQASSVPAHKNAMLFGTIEQLTVKLVAGLNDVNFSITAEARSFDDVHAQIKAVLSASSQNNEQLLERTVEVSQGDEIVASRVVAIKPGEHKELVLEQIPLPASNDNIFSLRILESDALAFDNQVHVAALGSRPEPVSIIQYSDVASSAALVFIDTALRSGGVANMSTATEADLTSGDSISHLVAFISQSDKSSLPDSLVNFINAGGNALLVVVPPDNNSQGDLLRGSPVTFVDQVHALALGRSDWSAVNLYTDTSNNVGASEQILLQSASGLPLLTEQIMDRGRLFVIYDALDGSSSNLPHQAAFVELVHGIMDYFRNHDLVPDSIEAGQPLSLPPRVRLIDPQGSPIGQLTDTGASQLHVLKQPGVYTLLELKRERALTVTLNSAESDIAPMSQTAIDAWQSRNQAEQAGSDTTVSSVQTAIGEQRRDIWHYLLPLFALLLLLESVYANRHLAVKRDG